MVLLRWLSGKESTCHCRRSRFNLWVGKITWRRKWQPTPVFLPEKSHGQWSLAGYRPWVRRVKSRTRLSDWVPPCTSTYIPVPVSQSLTPLVSICLFSFCFTNKFIYTIILYGSYIPYIFHIYVLINNIWTMVQKEGDIHMYTYGKFISMSGRNYQNKVIILLLKIKLSK